MKCFVFFILSVIIGASNVHAQKKLFIPKGLDGVPVDGNMDSDTSMYSNSRKASSKNIELYWAKEYGEDPMANPNVNKRFDVKKALAECERYYNFYVSKLKLVKQQNSVADRYKLLFFVTGGNDATAYGWGRDSVGVLWSPAVRINKEPYGVLAHELGHAFQYLSSCDYGTTLPGGITEMGAQYLLWQTYPNWLDFENYHLVAFLKGTHYAFLHPTNIYHSPFVLEYWSEKRGLTFYGDLLHNGKRSEDPVETYKRITGLSQQQFNDEMFDAYRRFITWDMKRIDSIARPYANKHFTKLNEGADGWYKISPENCPENYGYNGIQLQVPKGGKKIKLQFKGIAGTEGYRSVRTKDAGWRYGFVAFQNNGKRVYGKVNSSSEGKLSFKLPANTQYLWLVVMGAPKEHKRLARKEEEMEQWPYEVKFTGTIPVKVP